MTQEYFTEPRYPYATTIAFHYWNAQNLLQLTHRLGHCWLADTQEFGGLDYTLLSRNLNKRMQMAKFDPVPNHLSITL